MTCLLIAFYGIIVILLSSDIAASMVHRREALVAVAGGTVNSTDADRVMTSNRNRIAVDVAFMVFLGVLMVINLAA